MHLTLISTNPVKLIYQSKKILPVDDLSKAYLMKKFGEYYSKAELTPPPDFERREWAFVFLENLPAFFMHRHISFHSLESLRSFLISSPPAHIYYSSACYDKPSEPMERKGWLFADLIFDIDADHLPLKPGTKMEDAIEIAKREIIRLTEILENDFGVDARKIKIVFSGGRGYHIHVYDENFRRLESPERREIVDYLSLNSPEISSASMQMIRVRRCFLAFIKKLIEKGNLSEILKKQGLRKDVTERLEKKLKIMISDEELSKKFLSGKYSIEKITSSKKFLELTDKIIESCISKVGVHIDAPVTADVKRLIRFPGSIHGKSGLRVMEVSRDHLEEFDPFIDAIAFGDEKVEIRLIPNVRVEVRMGGEIFKLRGGEKIKIPEFLAVHLICRGMARYGY